jgi:hypothetical protein
MTGNEKMAVIMKVFKEKLCKCVYKIFMFKKDMRSMMALLFTDLTLF